MNIKLYAFNFDYPCNIKKYGYMDEENKIVIKPKYENALSFSEGLAGICINGKWGFIDVSEKIIIECKYDNICSFCNGFAKVAHKKYDSYHWGFINKSGKEITPIIYEELKNFNEGLAIVNQKYKEYFFIDTDGKSKFNESYSYADSFQNGIAIVGKKGDKDYVSKYGLIDTKGEIVEPLICNLDTIKDKKKEFDTLKNNDTFLDIKTIYPDIEDVKDSSSLYFIYKKYKWGILNKQGEVLCQFIFDDITRINDNYIQVKQGNYFGILDNSGRIQVPIICKSISTPTIDIVKCVFYYHNNSKYEYFTYNESQPFSTKEIKRFKGIHSKTINFLILEQDTKTDLFSLKDGFITYKDYQSIDIICQGIYVVELKKKFGLINDIGEEILLPEFDELSYYGGSYVICKINSLCKTFNIDTKAFELEIECEDLALLHYDETYNSDIGHLFVKIETDKYASNIPKTIVLKEVITVEKFKKKIGVDKIYLKLNSIAGKNGYVINDKEEIVARLSSKITKMEDIKNPMIGILENGTAYLYDEVKTYEIINSKGDRIFDWKSFGDEKEVYSSLGEYENVIESHCWFSLKYLPVFFSDSRILCRNDEEKFGFYDAKNSFMIIPFRYSQIIHRDDDFFDICKNDKWGILDIKNCKEILPCKYDSKIPHFFDKAEYQINGNKERVVDLIAGKRLCIVKEDAHYGCIDDSYKEIIPTIYHHIMFEVGNKFVFCGVKGQFEKVETGFGGHFRNAEWGCFDNNGNCILPVVYENIEIIEDYILAGKGSWNFQGSDEDGSYRFFDGNCTLFSINGEKIIDNFNKIQIDSDIIKVSRDVKYKLDTGGGTYHYVVDGYYSLYDKKGNLLKDRIEIEKDYIPKYDNYRNDDDNEELVRDTWDALTDEDYPENGYDVSDLLDSMGRG